MNSEITEITETKEERSPRHDHICPTVRRETPWRGDETLAPQTNHSFRGWILYDGACRSCTASARRFDRIFRRRGFLFLPLQTNWIMERLDLEPGAPLEEMRLLTADGRDIGGADAVIFLARQIWWAWPFAALAKSPPMHKLLDRGYRWIAAHRVCDHIRCSLEEQRSLDRRFRKSATEKPPLLEFSPAWTRLIMDGPLNSTSLGEFWGRRWNGPFNQLAFENLFRPIARSTGPILGTIVAFLASGLIHELVISLPARTGYGLPTAYFLLQGCGVVIQHRVPRIRHGMAGQFFTAFIVAVPAFWLFHPPFVRNVILPFMKAIGAL